MTSEIFKDCVKGCQISIVNSGKECIDFIEQSPKPDMVVVDFDLPDTDGVVLSRYLKRSYRGPVIITAFPDQIVDEAIAKELYAYNDSSHWVKKPVRIDRFSDVIEQFLNQNRRISKRFPSDTEVYCIGQSAGRGKRTPKIIGKMSDISMGGMKLFSPEVSKFSRGGSITTEFSLPCDKKPSKLQKISLQGEVMWVNDEEKSLGVRFGKMTDDVADFLEDHMRGLKALKEDFEFVAEKEDNDT